MQQDQADELGTDTMEVDLVRHRFPCCVVWTPIPILTWLFPFVGHMGIATSRGIIRDFSGSYRVSEDDMAFGWPTWYKQIDPNTIDGGVEAWDCAVSDASEEYKGHIHTLFCDNCYCHVALALNNMKYGHRRDYNCFRLVNMLMFKGRYVGIGGFIKQWFPFTMIILLLLIIGIVTKAGMVRLTIELINDSLQYLNTVRDRELSLRACKIPVLENLGVTKDQFDTIDLTDNDIRKLENIPLLRRLSTLLMHNNRVQQIMPNIGEVLPSLKTLALTNNNLCELGDIDPLSTCPKLEYLTLIGNPLTHKPQYRLYVIYKVPSVRVLDFKRVRLAERKQANGLFKGKKGQKFRDEIVKQSKAIPDDEEDGQPRNLRAEDVKKIEEAIASASSLVEVERLQAILQSGRVPESGWNRGIIGNVTEETQKSAKESNGFVAEQEDEGDDDLSPVASPDGADANDDVQSPVATPPQEEELDNGEME